MGMACLLFDTLGLVGFIPGIGTALNWLLLALAQAIFWYWLRKYDVPFFVDKKGAPSAKNIIATTVSMIMESLFGFLPAISLQIGIIVSTSWAEDVLAAKTGKAVSQNLKEKRNTPEQGSTSAPQRQRIADEEPIQQQVGSEIRPREAGEVLNN